MSYENLKPALERIKMTAGFIADHGQRTDTVFDLEDSFIDTPQMKASQARMLGDPEMSQRIKEGYSSPEWDLGQFIQYPRGTLAHTYASLLKVQGFNSHFYRDRPIENETDYCIMRVRKTHDLHHVVTGFGMAGGGELGVIGVTAYQFGYPAFALIDLTAIALAFQQAQGFQNALDLVGMGMNMGHRCKPLLGVKWEDGWDKPVARWREELGITPLTQGANSWYVSVPNIEA